MKRKACGILPTTLAVEGRVRCQFSTVEDVNEMCHRCKVSWELEPQKIRILTRRYRVWGRRVKYEVHRKYGIGVVEPLHNKRRTRTE